MEFFISEPYSLLQGDLIVAIVSGENSVGWSEPSTANTEGTLV